MAHSRKTTESIAGSTSTLINGEKSIIAVYACQEKTNRIFRFHEVLFVGNYGENRPDLTYLKSPTNKP